MKTFKNVDADVDVTKKGNMLLSKRIVTIGNAGKMSKISSQNQ